LEAMGDTARVCLTRLREIWPPDVHDMPLYPAFRSGSRDTGSGMA
jgi:hypothetical protein